MSCFKSCPRVGGICGHCGRWRASRGFKSCPRVGGIAHCLKATLVGLSFKSCPRVGGIAAIKTEVSTVPVSSRAPVWGASPRLNQMRFPTHRFKSCPRVGGIIVSRFLHNKNKRVSSRAPVWGASVEQVFSGLGILVSSRAPVWGASYQRQRSRESDSVSSRAPVWGASAAGTFTAPKYNVFQVVPPCGGHQAVPLCLARDRGVSSRAPVWGASLCYRIAAIR